MPLVLHLPNLGSDRSGEHGIGRLFLRPEQHLRRIPKA
jgi:hypothetical protein